MIFNLSTFQFFKFMKLVIRIHQIIEILIQLFFKIFIYLLLII